jgi:RHS repeat-associated protein
VRLPAAPLAPTPRRPRASARVVAVGAVVTAVVIGQASGALAAPATGPTVTEVVSQTLTPVLKATATAAGSGQQSVKFYARTVGSSTWNLLDGTTVSGTTGTATLPGGKLSVQDTFEFRAEHCDGSGCISSAVQTGEVDAGPGMGRRTGITGVPFTLGDSISAQIDAGSGNLLVSFPQLTLPRVAGDLSVGAVYNSTSRWNGGGGFATSLSSGWRLSTGSDVYLKREATTGAITYHGPNGLTGVFWPVAGTNTFRAPSGFTMDLTGDTTAGWSLYDHDSGDTRGFNAGGQLTTLKDRNGNATTFTYNGAALTSIVGEQGPTAARTLTVTTAGNGSKRITRISQSPAAGSGLEARSASYGYNADGQLTSVTDTIGRTTTLFYGWSGNLNTVTAPGGAQTDFTYDELGRVQSISQPTADGGTAVTRVRYPAGATTIADANTDQSKDALSVPYTRYDLTTDGKKLVAKATDPTGNVRSTTYTSFNDVASATNSAGTTAYAHDSAVNGGESLTGVTGASGATSSFSYGNTGMAQFLPSSGKDGQGNSSTYTYNGTGNKLSSTDAGTNNAKVSYNGDGTVKDSTSPSGAVTSYGYTDKQPTSVTPPAGTSLAARSYTYDGFGRLKSAKDGNGVTETYSYDAADRVTRITYSSGAADVVYTYDGAGNLASRVDGSGTTTYTYDPLGRLASRIHSSSPEKVDYTYDAVGNVATEKTTAGTTTYSYDSRSLVTRMTLSNGQLVDFGYDRDGRRVDTWTDTNAAHTAWASHTRTTYDASGRVTRVATAKANDDSNRVSDLSYNYAALGTGSCPTGPAKGKVTSLRSQQTDNITGKVTSYCYDTSNRLTSASTPGGDSWAYTYDADGNRTKTTKNGTVVQTQTVNAADQLTNAGFRYDGAGNETAGSNGTATYNGADQLSKLSGNRNASYTYAGTDQTELITTSWNGGSRSYTYGRQDSNGLPQIEVVTSNDNTSYVAHDPNGTPIALLNFTDQTHYYALDGLGSTVATVNQDGVTTGNYVYDPYGNATVTSPTGSSSTGMNPYRYAGGVYDVGSNLVHFGQRWYDPATGRFTQQDSLETVADPSRANRYLYAAGSPTNYLDPTGREIAPPGIDMYDLDGDGDTSEDPSSGMSETELKCYAGGALGAIGGTRFPEPYGSVVGAVIGCLGSFL